MKIKHKDAADEIGPKSFFTGLPSGGTSWSSAVVASLYIYF